MSNRFLLLVTVASAALSTATPANAQDAPIVQPGAPGQASKQIRPDDAIKLAGARFIQADLDFMQAMIPHHYQASQMVALVKDRTNTTDVVAIAEKIAASQDDEIAFMQQWLSDRGATAPDPAAHAKMGHDMAAMHQGMAGMASPEQMAALAAASGTEFDRMFLTLMVAHHKGALDMVDDLFEQQGSAYDPVMYRFVNDVKADQSSEIDRMNKLLEGLSDDPRTKLAAGFTDAESAIKGLTLVGSLPKPAGFFDPENPAGLRLEKAKESPIAKPKTEEPKPETEADPATKAITALRTALTTLEAAAKEGEAKRDPGGDSKTALSERGSLLNFANTDMAFRGDTLVVGNYHGFNIYDIAGNQTPKLVSSVVCPGGQGDVSIVGDLLIMSVEQTSGRIDCGLQGIDEDVSADRFRGLRIFDIANLRAPRQVGQVQTCRGSHTHSVVAEDAASILVYNSGTAGVRNGEELPGCTVYGAGERGSSLFSIDVIEIPKANPSAARIIDSPRVFADDAKIDGLWSGGDHGDGTQRTSRTDQCHDITIFPSKALAAGACSGNGIVLDIANPRAPRRIDDATDKGFAYWHSATFNNDGTKVVFTDEWGGGGRPRCKAQDPKEWGANAIYDLAGGELTARSLYKLPAAQGEMENCVAHNGSLVPVPGRDIFVQAWYQGGISLMDFTDSANPFEIAYFDRGPVNKDQMVLGGFWSVYWYNGRIYGTEIARGLDVFELAPSEFLTENEIAAAKLASQGETFNPQQQYPVVWPDSPVVARAYIDQLQRKEPMGEAQLAPLMNALDAAEAGDAGAAGTLESIAAGLSDNDPLVGKLAATLRGIAQGLRTGG
ncbi:DUF305 domain-containing protein [Parerythrobacter lacustris]|uniref:DUF305 domain-containing protein n=1 Tax=Parerythrobacter lacustris TaxID=2969984 RepID=A0ABT1XRE9_9SPHN|nr:DUF305 domain-containing protein [Parerythrobacter lacustris]MCR2834177.1 DUF305 domain-containing protein [Parerythrobacter lacustris]